MNVNTIAHHRLSAQGIALPTHRQPDEVVRWLVAMQAQDFAGAKWGVGLRMAAATDAALDLAFAEGTILRTHMLRPTWHFVSPDDIRWLLALTSPRVHAVNAHMYRKLELDSDTLRRGQQVLEAALSGGNALTRDELGEAFQCSGIVGATGQRLAYILMAAELDGLICSGPRRGKAFTYALLAERAPHARVLGRDEALAELIERYFRSRGPATVHDCARWSGLTVADVRRGLAAAGGQLHHEVIEGQSYWFQAGAELDARPSPQAHLLSIYDEYIAGYKERSAIVAEPYAARLWGMGNDLTAVIVVDGQVVGTWKRSLQRTTVTIETNLFTPLSDAEQMALGGAAQRYGAFLGLSAMLH